MKTIFVILFSFFTFSPLAFAKTCEDWWCEGNYIVLSEFYHTEFTQEAAESMCASRGGLPTAEDFAEMANANGGTARVITHDGEIAKVVNGEIEPGDYVNPIDSEVRYVWVKRVEGIQSGDLFNLEDGKFVHPSAGNKSRDYHFLCKIN